MHTFVFCKYLFMIKYAMDYCRKKIIYLQQNLTAECQYFLFLLLLQKIFRLKLFLLPVCFFLG